MLKRLGAGLLVTASLHSGLQAQFTEDEVLIESGSTWEYLLYATEDAGVFTPVDPALADPDFATTWQVAAGYDGPPFSSGPAPLGYGVITGDPIATNIWQDRGGAAEPPSGERYTAYFRTTFTPTSDITAVRLSGIVDDGAIIYLNGVEFGRTSNFAAGAPDAWDLLTTGTGSETVPVATDVPLALPAGVPVTMAVSMHQATTDSSDLGMNFRLVSLTAPDPSPPANDNVVDAEIVPGDVLPVTVTGRTHDGGAELGLGATLEAGEPAHAGVTNVGSVWYSFNPVQSGRYRVSTAASSFDAVIAVYTSGFALVGETTSDVTFYTGATLAFDAVNTETYLIAVSGEDSGGGPVLDENYGDVVLQISPEAPEPFTEISTLLPAGSDWFYLLYAEDDPVDLTLTNQPVDPETVDPDFDTTWQTGAIYDGPPFLGPSPAPLGYGTINAEPIATDIWAARDTDGDPATDNLVPPSGLRYAAYFATVFTPAEPVAHLGFRGLIDDGAVIYVNGVEVSRLNFVGDANDWQAFAEDAIGTEDAPQVGVGLDLNLPAGTPVVIGVSLHNPNATSSDMGFDLEIYSIERPVFDYGTDLSTIDPLVASFDAYAPGATLGAGDGGSSDNLPWRGSALSDEAGLPNSPNGAGNVLYVNNAGLSLSSGNIDLRGIDNSLVMASLDVRTFDTSSGFESQDFLTATLEGSADGINFTTLATLVNLSGSALNDAPVGPGGLEDAAGNFTQFTSSPGDIPEGIEILRVVISGSTNSDSEHLYIDNLSVGTNLGPPPAFTATITRNPDTGRNLIEWETDGSSVYELFYGDLQNWTSIASGEIGSFEHAPPAGDTEGYYQVRRSAD